MQKIRPANAKDCSRFIQKHKEQIISSEYDISIKEEWIKQLNDEELTLLVKYCESSYKELSKSSMTPKNVLEILSKVQSNHIRILVAKNLNTPKNILAALSKDSNRDVREAVAENINTPQEILEVLAKDSSEFVRQDVVRNTNTSINTLEILSNDKHWNVRGFVAENLRTPPKILLELAQDSHGAVRHSVIKNPNSPIEAFELLARDFSRDIRKEVAKSENTPKNILKLLAQDADMKPFVKNNPRYRKCFIATACYGDCNTQEVIMLQKFRDDVLLKYFLGEILIKIYYFISPSIANWLERNKTISKILRVYFLNILAFFIKKYQLYSK